jgi:predicted DNA-binding transcriptional regulator AlpA
MPRQIYRPPALCARLGISRSALYERIRQGNFPPANVQLGVKSVGWTEDIIDAAVERMKVERTERLGTRAISSNTDAA